MNNRPELRPSLCAFLDILGFADSILTSYQSQAENSVFAEVFSALTQSTKRISSAGSRLPMLAIKMFTDNIVIVYENDIQSRFSDLMHLCELISDYQLAMACKGYFIRGAISFGTIAINDQIIFGNALIKAHRLESTQASNPRVIIDPEVMEQTEQHLLNPKQNDQATRSLRIMKDVDGFCFVNYLSDSYVPVPCQGRYLEISEDILTSHRSMIEANLNKTQSNPHVWSKYFWSANYHNAFCDKVQKPSLKIGHQKLQPQPKTI